MTQNAKKPNDAAAEQDSNNKAAPASCPLNAPYLQLIPVRYAYVENLAYNANKKQTDTIHPIGIRLIRDGWLYIVAPHINRIYEHKLEDGIITERTFKGKLIGEIIRESYQEIEQESNKAQQLIFKKGQKIYVSYSQVQWADEKCNQMLKQKERKMFMQEIDLANLSCENITEHLLTREQAEKHIAEVAEKHKAPEYKTWFKEEKEAYSWTCTEFSQCSIGKITKNLRKEYEQKGNYLFMIVKDPIGQMLDLVQEQKLVTKWLSDWGDPDKEGLKYQIGSYIAATRTITEKNSQQKGSSAWIESLPPEKKQAVYDYANDAVAFEHEKNIYQEPDLENSTIDYTAMKPSAKYYERLGEVSAKKQKMINLITEAEYQKHKEEIDALIQHQKEHLNGRNEIGARGINQLVNMKEMEEYLANHRPRYNCWQARLDQITNTLVELYTSSFHMNTWYYSLFQRFDLLKLETEIIQDLFRNDEATQKFSQFLNEKPYYAWPAIQTNFTVKYLNDNMPVLTKWLDDTNNYVQITINGDPTALQRLESLIGRGYWKELLNTGGELADLERIRSFALSNPINYTLNRFVNELTGPAISEAKLTNFNSAIDRYVALSEQLPVSARASFILEIQRVGFVYLSEVEGATGRTTTTLNTINRNLTNLEQNQQTLDRTIQERERLRNPSSSESRALGTPEQRGREVTRLTREIERLQRNAISYQETIASNQRRLAELISPLQEGEGLASIRFNTTAEQQAALAFEEEALQRGALRMYGQANTKTLAAVSKSAMLPTFIAIYSIYNFSVEWGNYQKNKDYGNADRLVLFNSAIATLSASLSVWQVAHTTLLNEVVTRVNNISNSITGARLLGQIGKVNLILGASAQILNGAYSVITLITNYERWCEGILSGNTGLAIGSLAAAGGTVGNAGIGVYALRHTLVSGYQVYTELKAGAIASRLVWAGRGAIYATNIARATPLGILFTALQLTGEAIYNFYNLDEYQNWFYHSCWGYNNKHWNQQQHNQTLAEALLKPILIDKGVDAKKGDIPYRVIQVIFPGLLRANLAKHPIQWQAQWKNNYGYDKDFDSTIGLTLAQHTTLLDSEVVALEWRLPWLDKSEWRNQHKNVLNLRLLYTPDLATNYLYGGEGIGYQIPFFSWDKDDSAIEQVKGAKINIGLQAPHIIYKG